MPEYQPIAGIDSRDPMVRAYLECAEFAACLGDDQREALELSVSPRWSDESVAYAECVCADFEETFDRGFVGEYRGEVYGCLPYGPCGHDIWLTQNRHGAGFWDGDWPEPLATKATEWSHALGEIDVYFDEETEILHLEGI